MQTTFHNLLQEMGELLDLNLVPDTRSACTLLYQNQLYLQMETDAYEKYLLAACRICELPAGKFREDILLKALQFNNLYPLIATLSYSSRYNALTLSSSLLLENLTGKELYRRYVEWMRIASSWKKAIESGRSAPEPLQQINF